MPAPAAVLGFSVSAHPSGYTAPPVLDFESLGTWSARVWIAKHCICVVFANSKRCSVNDLLCTIRFRVAGLPDPQVGFRCILPRCFCGSLAGLGSARASCLY